MDDNKIDESHYSYKLLVISDLFVIRKNKNYAGIALAPRAPKTAEATAITILRSLSHQDDFVAMMIKYYVPLVPLKGAENTLLINKLNRERGVYPSGFSS